MLDTDDLIEEEVVVVIGLVSHALGLLQTRIPVNSSWVLLGTDDFFCVGP